MSPLPSLQTVRARLTFWNVGVLALVLLVLGGALRVTVDRNLMASVDHELQVRARRHQDFWALMPATPPVEPWRAPTRAWAAPARSSRRTPTGRPPTRVPPPAVERSQRRGRAEDRVYLLDGRPAFPFGGGPPWDAAAFAGARTGRALYTIRRVDGETMRLYTAPLRSQGRVLAVVQIGYYLADVERALSDLNRTLLTLIPVALVVAAVGGMFLTGRMLRPVRHVTATASRIRAEDLSQRLPVRGHDEFAVLASTMNEMLSRLERAFEQQRRFTADASHELRTPLTVIKANTSLALSRGNLAGEQLKAMQSIDRAASLMNRVVQDLLLLARSDSGQLALTLKPTRLSDVLAAAADCASSNGGPHVQCTLESPSLTVLGDASHLSRLFANLIENAVRHTPADGRLAVDARTAGPSVVVRVEDSGSGIAPEHLPHVCERFYRADEARSREHGGTGLGLPICDSIVKAHCGSMRIESSPGQGTTVTVTLPAAPTEN